MATPRDIRRLALLALYQLDARGDADAEWVRAAIEPTEELLEEGPVFVDTREPFTARDRERAFELATRAFGGREAARPGPGAG